MQRKSKKENQAINKSYEPPKNLTNNPNVPGFSYKIMQTSNISVFPN